MLGRRDVVGGQARPSLARNCISRFGTVRLYYPIEGAGATIHLTLDSSTIFLWWVFLAT